MTAYAAHTVLAVTGLTKRQLNYWITAGLITPSIERATSRGTGNRFSFTDIVALRTCSTLRHAGMSLQALRRVAEYLHNHSEGATFANTWLTSDGVDVFERRGDDMISALRRPGQAVITTFMVDLGTISTEVMNLLARQKTKRAA
jgi:DNA-binding transcriptional MerR regulator